MNEEKRKELFKMFDAWFMSEDDFRLSMVKFIEEIINEENDETYSKGFNDGVKFVEEKCLD